VGFAAWPKIKIFSAALALKIIASRVDSLSALGERRQQFVSDRFVKITY
jgi:hypothetical protein